jgi:DedD protein
MIFDSEPKPLTDDIAIHIPSRDKQGSGASAPMVMPPLPEQPVEPKKALQPAVINPTSDTKPEVKAEPALVPADKSTETANLKPGAEKPVQKSTEKPASVAEKGSASRFVLQVAAVANKSKAEELQAKLKHAGIKSYSQKISTKDGERYRIRVGPYGNRDEAEKMRSRLSKMGLSVVVQSV